MKHLLQQEYIGKQIMIADAKNKTLVNMQGIIIDETKHTFLLETTKGQCRVFKHSNVFEFIQNNKRIQLNGTLLVGRPEDRIKRKRK